MFSKQMNSRVDVIICRKRNYVDKKKISQPIVLMLQDLIKVFQLSFFAMMQYLIHEHAVLNN